MTEYFRVKNWEKFQHYKQRRPPWIKLHESLLDDYEFMKLSDTQKAHLIMMWLLAGNMDNKIPLDTEWLSQKISATCEIDASALLAGGWIELIDDASTMQATRKRSASKMLARCKQSAMPETETETETETEKRSASHSVAKATSFPPALASEKFRQSWDTWKAFRVETKHKLTPSTEAKQLAKLATWGEAQAIASIEQSIEHGWQGLFEPKTNGKPKQRECFRDRGIMRGTPEQEAEEARLISQVLGGPPDEEEGFGWPDE